MIKLTVVCVLFYSKIQARFAFAMYLSCIQRRLMEETHHHADSTSTSGANEQMVCFLLLLFVFLFVFFKFNSRLLPLFMSITASLIELF
jgi:hypothetical protein